MKRRMLALLAVLSLGVSGAAWAAGTTDSDKSIEDRLRSYEIRLEALEAENKALKAKDTTVVKPATEVKDYATRLDALEKKEKERKAQDDYALKITGWAYFRYDWNNETHKIVPVNYYQGNPTHKNETRPLLYLFFDKKLSETTYFHGSFGNEMLSGQSANVTNDAPVQFYEGFYGGKAGAVDYKLGRMVAGVGKGLLLTAAYCDGVSVGFGTDVRTTLYNVAFAQGTYWMADVTAKVDPVTSLTLAYTREKPTYYPGGLYTDNYNSTTLGFDYKGIQDIQLLGEYGVNIASGAKAAAGGSTPHAYFVKAKYKGANPFVLGSGGFWISYRDGQKGFDTDINANNLDFPSPYNYTYPSNGGMIDNTRGFEFGAEATVAPSAIWKISYATLKANADDSYRGVTKNMDEKYLVSSVNWFF